MSLNILLPLPLILAAAVGSTLPGHLEKKPNLTQLQLRAVVPPRSGKVKDTPLRVVLPPTHRPVAFAAQKAPNLWNAPSGRAAASSHLQIGQLDGALASSVARVTKQPPGAGACEAVKLTESPDCGCASYPMPDATLNNKNVWYYQPLHAFGDEQSARNFAITVTPKVPLLYPFHDPTVHPVQGWFYDNGNFHGAVDYVKTADQYGPGKDPSFPVHASGDGVVIAVFWDSWSGNIVILEHTAPDGSKVRTSYFHLRNGFDHDLAQAKQTVAVSDPTANQNKYLKYANLPSPSSLLWGTNAQKILVKAGDKVLRGQQIAWSGDTGPGGAGAGLNVDGTPTDPNTANNHLHMMVAVPDPKSPGDWVQVDAFGVYNTLDNSNGTNCYDLDEKPAYARLIAPFPPSFHNLPADALFKYWGYYTGMGMAPQTFSFYRAGGQLLAAGAFQWGLSTDWYAYAYMTMADSQTKFDAFFKQGYRPREVSIVMDDSNQPRVNHIWKKMAGESFYEWLDMSDDVWLAKWNDLVKQKGFRVEDHFEWSNDGKRHHAGIFVKDGVTDFYELHGLSAAGFQSKFDDYFKQGYQLVDVNTAEIGGQRSYGGIWMKRPGAFMAYVDMSADDYQSIFWTLHQQGYQLSKVQGYGGGNLFGAIWTK
jgi:murein DD-endopeptidase MepM/ murein hydrolase activator NlpD